MGSGSEGLAVSAALREQFLLLSTAVSRPKGTILFSRGDPCAGVFLIRSGKVRLALDIANSAFRPRILGAGCVVGLPSAVGGSDYSLTAEVVEDAELACVSQKALTDCLRENSFLCFEVMDILSHEISETRSALKHNGGLHA
ncbi:MAG: Crp/Fnr family transcriptional regulator [Terriglobales bacterium]|jgi:CRP-like cAMP-binding protein